MDSRENNMQKYIDILVVSDFIVSIIGVIMKSRNEQIANYCFAIGGGLLFLAVIGIIYRNLSR